MSLCYEFIDKNTNLSSHEVSLEFSWLDLPIPVYQRGVWLSATNEILLPELVLNTRFTIEFIVRPQVSGSLLKVVNKLN